MKYVNSINKYEIPGYKFLWLEIPNTRKLILEAHDENYNLIWKQDDNTKTLNNYLIYLMFLKNVRKHGYEINNDHLKYLKKDFNNKIIIENINEAIKILDYNNNFLYDIHKKCIEEKNNFCKDLGILDYEIENFLLELNNKLI